MRSVEFHPEAQDEFISAAQFYERQADGLGLDFIPTVQHTYERLLGNLVESGHEPLAQSVEHLTFNQGVQGSNP